MGSRRPLKGHDPIISTSTSLLNI